ncbi:hypothetical protein NIES2101_01395 [Calothrix sp. HK-06]|nr:hypothetical protein NIES2101_01395 [Calothrix sp. HK-06]
MPKDYTKKTRNFDAALGNKTSLTNGLVFGGSEGTRSRFYNKIGEQFFNRAVLPPNLQRLTLTIYYEYSI